MGRVLVVDDDIEIRNQVREFLNQEGHDVVLCSDGFEALEKLNLCPYDLILLDINMPYMNGYQLTQRIRTTWGMKFTSICFLTARNTDEDVNRAIRLGADDYIVKPFTKEVLKEKVDELMLIYSRTENRPSLSLDQSSPHAQKAQAVSRNEVKLCNINEIGVEVETDFQLGQQDFLIHLSSQFFTQLGYESVKMKIDKATRDHNGVWKSFLMYQNPTYEFIDKVRTEVVRINKNIKNTAPTIAHVEISKTEDAAEAPA
ncbi:MAG: hypothetical protein CL677_01775 [Bdellovibrionaceae bacterium]|nr:hypothetical protein [Pseudobdellovibrionaceae bacterium]|tara:strand:- start:1366 stop:2139 length:774 start_codon:yes stop_codon:yes gene_type:complete